MDSLKLPSMTEIYTDLERWRLKQTQSETDPKSIPLLLSKHHSQHHPVNAVLGNYHSHIDSVEIHNSAPKNKNTQLNSIINLRCGSL